MALTYNFLDATQQRRQIESRLLQLEREHWDNHLTLLALQSQPTADEQAIGQISGNLATIQVAHAALTTELANWITEAAGAGIPAAPPPAATNAQPT